MKKKYSYKVDEVIDQAYRNNKSKIDSAFNLGGVYREENVKEGFTQIIKSYMRTRGVYVGTAVKEVLNSNSFTSPEERYKTFLGNIKDEYIKGHKREIRKYLGIKGPISQNENIRIEYDSIENAHVLMYGFKKVYIKRGDRYKEEKKWEIYF